MPNSATTTILIADDDPLARRTLHALIASEGHAIVHAERGDTALRLAGEQNPDLVILDVVMPGMDGFAVCRALRQSPQLREVPVLLVTSLSDRESRLRGLTAGADGFLTKPYDTVELLAQVRTIVKLGRYRRLLAEQERFQRLVELSPEGVAVIAADGRVLLANSALVSMLAGGDASQVVGVPLGDFVAPGTADRFLAALRGLGEPAPQPVRAELYLVSRAGRTVPVEVSAGRFEDDAGAYAQVIVRDISDRKQAEAQIQRQISQLTSLHAIGVAITASLQLDSTLAILLDRLLEQLEADAAAVLLLNRRTQLLELSAARGVGVPDGERPGLRPDEGLAGATFQTRRATAIPSFDGAGLRTTRDHELAAVFGSYFALPLQARGEIAGVLEIMYRRPHQPDHAWWVFVEALALQAAIAIDTAALFGQLQHAHAELTHSYDATIQGWSRALDLRDHETEGHSSRVTELSLRLARRMGLPETELDHIRRGALLHDIGKMGVPDSILLKPAPLSPSEWDVMRQHPTYAYTWLAPIPFLHPALAIPYAHHEHWDGSGYPRGLRGEQIPLSARIFAVVDVWDALRSNRPYRSPWPEERVVAHIRSLSGTHFDPRVVAEFLELLRAEGEGMRR